MKSLEDLKKLRENAKKRLDLRNKEGAVRICVGMATCGITAGAKQVMADLLELVEKYKLENVVVTQVGCIGECALEPIVEIKDNDGKSTIYAKVGSHNVEKIIKEHIIDGKVISNMTLEYYKD